MEKNLNNTSVNSPRVTIIIPTHNRADLISEAITSIQKQTFNDWEMLIMDDASTDNTTDIVANFAKSDSRIKYFRQSTNVGIARNRNTGLDQARGEYIAMLDSDDIWLDPKKLTEQVNFLDSHPEHALVGTQVKAIDIKGKEISSEKFEYETRNSAIRKKILSRNQFTQSSVLYRLSAAREVGCYDTSIVVNDDYSLWLALGTKYKLANLSEYMTGYRIHPQGITKTRKLLSAQEHLTLIKKYRGQYPNYFPAMIKAHIRILLSRF